ncbi:Paxillin [Lamellibrachia satsuma]|nr:Paxillin [Lamellibrachia satsuma]
MKVAGISPGYSLLADLQSTTAQSPHPQSPHPQSPHPQSPHPQSNPPQQPSLAHVTKARVNDAGSRDSSPPPPLPPPPSQDVIDSLHDNYSQDCQPIYEPQNVRQVQQTVVTTTAITHNPPQPLPGPDRYPAGPPVAAPQQPVYQEPVVPKKHESSLSNNLSELDTLLQDLSSAQFIAEVDRRNAANTYQELPRRAPPVVSPKPRLQDHSVDNLLTDLESSVPQPNMQQQQPAYSPQPQQAYAAQTQQAYPAQTQQAYSPQLQQAYSAQPQQAYSHYEQVNIRQSSSQAYPPPQMAQHAMMQASSTAPPTMHGMLPGGAQQHGTASTATRELDDLMASLSEFKVTSSPQHVGEPPYAQPMKLTKMTASDQAQNASVNMMQQQAVASGGEPQNNNLEAMLGNLHTDMSRQGVTTVPKGHCAACAKPIVGQVITALGKIWHPEHFTCCHCKQELGTCNFFERDGRPYCETDYHNLFSPRCAHCQGPILDKCVTALELTWHPEHFFCAQCGRTFGEDGFHEKDGKAFCREDYFELFAPKCGGCSRPIMDNFISALGRQWHPECFVCQECHTMFGTGSFFDHEGLPYCETHYHARRGSLCAGCHKPITGRCITAMYKKFHPEHFVCAFCLKQLNKGTFKEQNDKPYCHPCFVKLFG